MNHDWSEINETLNRMQKNIDAAVDCIRALISDEEWQHHIDNLRLNFGTLRRQLMLVSTSTGAPDSQPAQTDRIVTVTIDGTECTFNTFERHMLYCIDEDRRPSTKIYSRESIVRAYRYMHSSGYADMEDQTEYGYILTELGKKAVDALRAAPR